MAVKSYALTTAARLRDFMGINSWDATETTVAEAIIDAMTEYIENYTGRRFKQTAYSNELYDGDGSNIIQLKNYPISSTASFDLDYRTTTENDEEWGDIDSDYYYIDYNAGFISLAGEDRFTRRRFMYRVSYTAGYDFDNAATYLSDTEAGDLEYAMWKLCAQSWNRRTGDDGVKSESIGDYAITYGDTGLLTPDLKAILDKYRRNSVYGGFTVKNT